MAFSAFTGLVVFAFASAARQRLTWLKEFAVSGTVVAEGGGGTALEPRRA
jgi:hypothetical protein